jgi:hypothetical protein
VSVWELAGRAAPEDWKMIRRLARWAEQNPGVLARTPCSAAPIRRNLQ